MTHITETRVIGNHADMGPARVHIARRTLADILRAGTARRRLQRELDVAEAQWDSEGGAVGH